MLVLITRLETNWIVINITYVKTHSVAEGHQVFFQLGKKYVFHPKHIPKISENVAKGKIYSNFYLPRGHFRFSENHELVNPEMKETVFSVSKS